MLRQVERTFVTRFPPLIIAVESYCKNGSTEVERTTAADFSHFELVLATDSHWHRVLPFIHSLTYSQLELEDGDYDDCTEKSITVHRQRVQFKEVSSQNRLVEQAGKFSGESRHQKSYS